MTTSHSERIAELLPAYALGALDGEDLRELEEHLAAGCAECRRQLDLWQGDLEALAQSVPPLEPSETTRARILRLPAAAPAPQRRPRWLPFAAAALLLLGVWGIAGQIRMRGEVQRLSAERDRLEHRVAALDREVEQARSEARRAAEALQVLAAPQVSSVVLAGLGPTPGAAGHTYVNPQTHDALFYAFNLPALKPEKTYQLWFIAGGKPVSAGVFSVDPRGTGSLRVENVVDTKDIQAWAVTVEPRGGVPQPTGEMVLKG
ncbi:MAG TPA: anti-sigma factor [Thermoanaerobaculia bacterium]|jgi:anti-sigma-K factor RskA|nr:anti-sigma factor [Thermoanaerobaculia bacterium]